MDSASGSPHGLPQPLVRRVVATSLGPCAVRTQPGTGTGREATETADLYLHGAAGSWTTFIGMIDGPHRRDRVVVDLPGWGESALQIPMEDYSIEKMAQAVVEVMDALGHSRWNAVGHSMGGVLALHLAARWPERTVSAAALSATTFGVSRAAKKPLRNLTKIPWLVGMMVIMRSLAGLGVAGDKLMRAMAPLRLMRAVVAPVFASDAVISNAVSRGLGTDARPASFTAAVREVGRYSFGQWEAILCPVLALRGDQDAFTPESDLRELKAVISHARLVTLTHCGHFAPVEHPAEVNALLASLWSEDVAATSGR